MDRKYYSWDICPYCGGNLRDAGKSKMGHNILQCTNCRLIGLEKDIDKIRIRKEQNEGNKVGK